MKFWVYDFEGSQINFPKSVELPIDGCVTQEGVPFTQQDEL